jgi:hypothetical protein
MVFRGVAIAVGIVLLSSWAPAQTTQPSPTGRLDYRAARAFERGDYTTALPLLRKLAEQLKDRPAKQAVTLDRIKACEEALAKTGVANPYPSPYAHRKIHPLPEPGQVLDLSIKELGNFDYDADLNGKIPDDVKQLSGCKIRLTGFMIPSDQAQNITQFVLVPSLFACCFGQPPQIQHTIVCVCPKGQTVRYDPQQVIVEGTLKVEEKRDDGYVTSLFQVEPTSVTPAPKEPKR